MSSDRSREVDEVALQALVELTRQFELIEMSVRIFGPRGRGGREIRQAIDLSRQPSSPSSITLQEILRRGTPAP